MLTLFLALGLAAQQAATGAQPPTSPVQAPPAPTQPRRAPASIPTTVQVRVTDRLGAPASGVQVTAEGAVRRDGVTSLEGLVTFRTVTPGTYRLRAEAEGFLGFEKEVVVRSAAPLTTDMALSPAPPPPAPPPPPLPPPPEPPRPASKPPAGQPRIVSLPELAARSLEGRDAIRTEAIGCTGVSRSQLLVVRESLTAAASNDQDEMLYVVAGEATLRLAGKEQALTPGWFTIVPHGTSRVITRRGRNPAILLSIVAGEPCTTTGDTSSRP